jgi:hypothetical protein
LAAFLRAHKADLHGTLSDLVSTTNELLAHQRALIDTLDNLPLAGQNIGRVGDSGTIVVQQVPGGDDPVLAAQLKAVCTALPTLCNALLIPLNRPATSGDQSGLGKVLGTTP